MSQYKLEKLIPLREEKIKKFTKDLEAFCKDYFIKATNIKENSYFTKEGKEYFSGPLRISIDRKTEEIEFFYECVCVKKEEYSQEMRGVYEVLSTRKEDKPLRISSKNK